MQPVSNVQLLLQAKEKSLREDGIDPRLISTVEKESDFDAMSECETNSVLTWQNPPELADN